MDPGLQILLWYAVTHNTPLKLRTSSVPTIGKLFKAENVNQDLLVELEGATINKNPFEKNSHYILAQCDQILPSMDHLLQALASAPLKITSLKHQIYDSHWEVKEIPHILRTSSASSSSLCQSQKSNNACLRCLSIRRVIPGTSLEESIKGTFLPNAGTEEECIMHWLNKATEALMALGPSHGPLMHSCMAAKPACFWLSEASCKPIKDNMMTLKPDLILWEKPHSVVIRPQPEFSWNGVISFLELTSSTYQDSVGTRNVHNAIMHKAYAIFASQPG